MTASRRCSIGWCAAGAACALIAGCGALTDADYRGKPLAVLTATTNYASKLPVIETRAAIVWMPSWPADFNFDQIGGNVFDGEVTATLAETSTEFPSNSQIMIYEPPPAEAMFGGYHFRHAEGRLVVVTPDRIGGGTGEAVDVRDAIIGGSEKVIDRARFEVEQFSLVYLSADPPAGIDVPYGLTTAGYHLVRRRGTLRKRCTPADVEACVATWPPPDPGWTQREDLVRTRCGQVQQATAAGVEVSLEESLTMTIPATWIERVSEWQHDVIDTSGGGYYAPEDLPTCLTSP